MPAKLAAELDRIRLGEPVNNVPCQMGRHGYHGILGSKTALGGFNFNPGFMLVDAQDDPPMPPMRAQLTQRVPMGCCAKVLVSYDRPFWRE